MNKNTNHTFCMIKPDICERNKIGELISILEDNHFKIIKMEMKQMTAQSLELFYEDHKGKFFFDHMIARIANGFVVGLMLEYGKNGDAVIELRNLMGATNPKLAVAGTIRHSLALDIDNNSIHGSDTPANVIRESSIFFKDK